MNKRLLSVLAFALVVSAGAAFVLYQLISSKVNVATPSAARTTSLFVAARDLELGALIQDKDIRAQEYLTPPAGAIAKKEDLVGRGVTSPIHMDAPFFETSLAPKGAGAGFAATIPKGMRAFAVHVNEVMGVAGFVVAGMRVDILISGVPPGAGSDNVAAAVARTLLQNIEILSAGQNYQKDAEGKPVIVQVVNLLVTPEQAEVMNLATDQKIQLVLRNPADHDIVHTPGASAASLFQNGAGHPVPATLAVPGRPVRRPLPLPPVALAGPVVPPAPAEPVTVQVFAGSRRTDATFQDYQPAVHR